MNTRFRRTIATTALAALTAAAGCSNLVVKKVPLAKRAEGRDHQQGFRYYLSRPYLVVKEPVLIHERRTLVEVDGAMAQLKAITYLEGDRKGQVVRTADLAGRTKGRRLQPLSPADIGRLRDTVASQARATSKPGTIDPEVGRAAHQEGPPLPIAPDAPWPDWQDPGFSRDAPAGGVASAAGGERSGDGGGDQTLALSGGSVEQNASTEDLSDHSVSPEPSDTAALDGAFQVVYLPDLDEQYVVKSKNWLAKTSFGLAFRDGVELTGVSAEHDSTTVAIALLDLLQQAIGQAQKLEQTRIKQSKSSTTAQGETSAPAGARPDDAEALAERRQVYQLVERTYIQQGMYRLNKPWEVDGPGVEPGQGLGLLAKLGLPHRVDSYLIKLGDVE